MIPQHRILLILISALSLAVPVWAADHAGHDHAGHDHAAATQPSKSAAEASAVAAESAGDVYGLSVCAVTGEALGSMGDPVIHHHEGREVRFCCAGCAPAFKADPARYLAQVDAALMKQQRPLYPMDTCPVSGEALTNPEDRIHGNRLVRFCCPSCVSHFEKNPAKTLALLDKAVVAAQKDDYPLATCVVTGEALGSHGDIVEFVHANRLFRFCCPGCIAAFRKDPVKSHQALDAAYIAKQKADYPLETCVVAGGKLGSMGDPVDYLHGNTLVRFCCAGCTESFEKDPAGYLKTLSAARDK